MNLQLITHSPYTFLPSGILIVEPHEGLLAARTIFLAAADYYVGISSPSGTEAPEGISDGYEVAVAILSESLGHTILNATARTIRERWRHARIFVLGPGKAGLEDNLYDARIDPRARPENLLAALLILSADPWNQRGRPAKILTNGKSGLSNGGLNYIAESDPTKRHANLRDIASPRDLPAGEKWHRAAKRNRNSKSSQERSREAKCFTTKNWILVQSQIWRQAMTNETMAFQYGVVVSVRGSVVDAYFCGQLP